MKIREFLTEANWGKGLDVTMGQKMCLGYAVTSCCPSSSSDRRLVLNKIQHAIGGGSIVKWNDAPERTFAEVKALVEKLDI